MSKESIWRSRFFRSILGQKISCSIASTSPNDVSAVIATLKSKGIPSDQLDPSLVKSVLESKSCNGSVSKAIRFLLLYRDAEQGTLLPVISNTKPAYHRLAGAENYNGVTCYLNSLMFAMFARLENFEAILYKDNYTSPETSPTKASPNEDSPENNKKMLAASLRFYVNLIRSGKLITSDISKSLLDIIFDCGWQPMSGRSSQQDVSELFTFITEMLDMPLLTLKMDIAHGGEEVEEDDHRLINESILHVPVPGSQDDHPVLLEECLEQYFSNSVNVSRQLERRRTLTASESALKNPVITRERTFSLRLEPLTTPSTTDSHPATELSYISPGSTRSTGRKDYFSNHHHHPHHHRPNPAQDFPSTNPLSNKSSDQHIGHPDPTASASHLHDDLNSIHEFPTIQISSVKSNDTDCPEKSISPGPPAYESLFDENSSSPEEKSPIFHKDSPLLTNTLDKTVSELWNESNEITLPAWMFLQLLPFYSNSSGGASRSERALDPGSAVRSSASTNTAAEYFATARPVLGICLKRYTWTSKGQPQRNARKVKVPSVINLPTFVADSQDVEGDRLGKFKLVLESAIFHRGTSINSGHYVALIAEEACVGYVEDTQPSNVTETSTSKLSPSMEPSKTSASKKDRWKQFSKRKFSTKNELNRYVPLITKDSKRWLLLDDMGSKDKRVQEVDFDETFDKECPYLLFYRMVAAEEPKTPADSQRHEQQEPGEAVTEPSNVTTISVLTDSATSDNSRRESMSSSPSTPGSFKLPSSWLLSFPETKLSSTSQKSRSRSRSPPINRSTTRKVGDPHTRYRDEKCTLM